MREHYIVTRDFMYMIGKHDSHGNVYTRVKEKERTLFVNKSPLEILEYSIKCIGFNLRGALESSKWLLNNEKMCPIMVNPLHRIVLFPTKSPKHQDNIWFNPTHIKRTSNDKGNTLVIFTDTSTLTIPVRLSSFNHKIQTAEQLEKLTREMSEGNYTLVLDSVQRLGK